MIVIKISNHQELIEREKGWLLRCILPLFVDVETSVEAMIAKRLKSEFGKNRIDAEIEVVSLPVQ